jgi:CubicO group peptidase (beta-lactamase class C family)
MTDLDARADSAFLPALEAIREERIPGAVLGIVTAEGRRALRFAGLAQREPEPALMTADTVFDLASLTKVIFTTSAILSLVEAGRIGLDDPLAMAIPDLRQYDVAGAPERRLTLRQCLTHQTHLPAVEPLYSYGQDPQTLRAFVLQRVWTAGPPVYSDINFILLGIVIERLTGLPLIDQPLPPGFTFRPDPARCAATERCTWRGRIMRGQVHDENAYALGGIAPHAGLFGTAPDIARFAQMLLNGGVYDHHRIVSRETVELFTRRAGIPDSSRALGWDTPSEGSSGGTLLSPRAFGHTGFTGTSMWLDPERRLFVVLLTNRVHPTRENNLIRQVRPAVADAVVRALETP